MINPSPANLKTNEWAVRFIAHDTPASLVAGHLTTVHLHVENVGIAKWLAHGTSAVYAGYQWFDSAGRPVREVENRRTGLPSDLYPRQETRFGATLVAPTIPGTYRLQWNLLLEKRGWFDSVTFPPLVVPVNVTETPRDITGWRVESNLNIAHVAHALDGDPTTCWESGTPQARGQWFRLNLGAPRMIDGIQFLSPGKGFPASFALNLSADGRTWLEIARGDAGNAYDVMAIFAPQLVQYAQIDLLGPASTPWMISEILVHASPAWTASASHNGKQAQCAIDNRKDTAWSSGATQTKEMWFAIDLGQPEMIGGLTLISPNDGVAASYRIAVWNAGAHRWQVVSEKLSNVAPVDVVFDAIQTQFISVQLLQASERPWVIQHFQVHREMEQWLAPTP